MNTQEIIHIPYGSKLIELPLSQQPTRLVTQEPVPDLDEKKFVSQLENFLKDTPLDLSSPTLVVTDKTRRCDYPIYLPLLIEQLEKHGMNPEDLTILIAYGTHQRQSEEESLATYGEIYNQRPFIHHDCMDQSVFRELGATSSGTLIRIRKDILDASALITMGPICHHYFAGYGGGRKLIFPGCGERGAIYQNHGLFLDATQETLSSGCQPGNLHKNPLADDLFEIEKFAPADLAIHGIPDSHGKITQMLFGNDRETYLQACAAHASNCEVHSDKYATVIASCGGFPKDINFIQSHKAIHNAAMFVQDGGLLVVYSECRDAIGSKTFLPWFRKKDYATAFQALHANYEGNGGTALAMMTKLRRIRIAMITELDQDTCDLMGVEKWDLMKAEEELIQPQESLCWIENASLLVKKL